LIAVKRLEFPGKKHVSEYAASTAFMIDIQLHPEAFRDYEEAYDWYAKQDIQVAEQFDADLQATLAKLIQDPTYGVPLGSKHYFFRLKRFPYFVVFEMRQNLLWVIAVSQNSRDPNYWRGR
jgi:toxin ParE1/3/4